jgi:conjugative relaxase-like TrwC/TraI family protein
VLTVAKVLAKAATATAEYFAELRPTGDYYVNEDGDPYVEPGGWIGIVARALGQAGELGLDELLRVLDGRHPETGGRLVRTWKRWTRDRIAAHDLCFSAPGSVSTLWASAEAPTRAGIQAAHDEAVAYAFAHIEEHAKVVRRRDTTKTDPETGISPHMTETAAGLLGATYRHHTTRQTRAQAAFGFEAPPGPQLHTHVLVFMAQRHDGKMVAVDGPALFKGAREAGAIYRARPADREQRTVFRGHRGSRVPARRVELPPP